MTHLITLPETCCIILSASPKLMKHVAAKKLESRWSHARSMYMSEHGFLWMHLMSVRYARCCRILSHLAM